MTLDEFKKLGRDSIIGIAKLELNYRYKRIGLKINCYSRVEVLAGVQNGREVLYVNFDNPVSFYEVINPFRIGVELMGGESYYSTRGAIEQFYCNNDYNVKDEFFDYLKKAETGGNLAAIPTDASPASNYMEVIDYGGWYRFDITSDGYETSYRLFKNNLSLEKIGRVVADPPKIIVHDLTEIK